MPPDDDMPAREDERAGDVGGRRRTDALLRLIREKLADGRLPHDSIPRVWGGAGNGETCDACDRVITTSQWVMEGVSTDHGQRGVQLHVKCFQLWDDVRIVPGRRDADRPDVDPGEPRA